MSGSIIRGNRLGDNMGTTIQLTYAVEIDEDRIPEHLTLKEWVDSRVYQSGVDLGIGEGELTLAVEYE